VQLNKLLNEVRENFKDIDYFDLRKQTGTFRYAVIRTPGKSSSISFVLNSDSTRITEGIERIKGYAKISSAENIAVTYAKHNEDRSITEDYFMVKGSDMLHDTFHGKDFFYNVQGFFQNNPQMAEQMLGYVHELLKKYETKDALLVDLYGGVGTFGLVNSELFKQVYVIESYKGSIDAADINIKHNNIKNAKGFVMDAKNVKKLNLFEPLFMIIDPPRTGLEQKALLAIKELKPKVIIYISCNPAQLAKELPKLKMNLKSVAMFDLFPQTPHVEAVLELTRD
jgi:23S rRNA (uracil1939-C5)-methyltransferase